MLFSKFMLRHVIATVKSSRNDTLYNVQHTTANYSSTRPAKHQQRVARPDTTDLSVGQAYSGLRIYATPSAYKAFTFVLTSYSAAEPTTFTTDVRRRLRARTRGRLSVPTRMCSVGIIEMSRRSVGGDAGAVAKQ